MSRPAGVLPDRVFLGLGASFEDGAEAPARERLEAAMAGLMRAGWSIAAVAPPVATPFEDDDGAVDEAAPAVLNTVLELRSSGSPEDVLAAAARLETAAGRDRSDPSRRTLDVDVLAVGDAERPADPVLPHPRCLRRAFVLGPWREIAPLFVVPGSDATVLAHARALAVGRPEAFGRLTPRPPLALPDLDGEARLLASREEVAAWRGEAPGRVALVPTMGALHEGHAALVRRARAQAERVVVSVFVNPLQFAPGEDLEAYPRTFDSDVALLRRLGVDAVYAPEPGGFYPPDHSTYVVPEGPARGLEGEMRPEHFRGVATVVHLLFRRTRPHVAVFGRKDAQQAAVVERMARDLEMGVEIDVAPIVRDPDGLALSSRNRYLSEAERARARALPRTLEAIATALGAPGTAAAAAGDLLEHGVVALREAGVVPEYLQLVDSRSLAPMNAPAEGDLERPALLVAAARVGTTRLLDNRWVVPAARVPVREARG